MTPKNEHSQQSSRAFKAVGNSHHEAAFNINDFAAREQRRVARLVRAAYGVGHAKEWFRTAPRSTQEEYVQLWVDEALDFAAERRARAISSNP